MSSHTVYRKTTMKNIRCIYIARAELPSTSANAVHIMKISEEFDHIFDGSFRLLVHKKEDTTESICDRYGTGNIHIDSTDLNSKSFLFRYRFAIKTANCAAKFHPDVVITRDPLTALLLGIKGIQVVLDLHGDVRHLCGRGYHFFKINYLTGLSAIHYCAITSGLRDHYLKNYSKNFEKMFVLPDGVTVENFSQLSAESVFSQPFLRIGYIGKLTRGKGIDIICQLAKLDPKNKYYIYGGSRESAESEIEDVFPNNVSFGGYVDNKTVPSLIEKLDVLLLPNKADQVCQGENIGQFTSPLKMFEYMASNRPIIASDIRVLREVLNDDNSFLVSESNAGEWLTAIKKIEGNHAAALAKAAQAKADVQQYTWRNRALCMLEKSGISY